MGDAEPPAANAAGAGAADAGMGGADSEADDEGRNDDEELEADELMLLAGQRACHREHSVHGSGKGLVTGVMAKRWRQHATHVKIREIEVERERRIATGEIIGPTRLVDEEIRPLARLRAERAQAAGSAERRSAAAAAERARWHHEIRWSRDDEWKLAHDGNCVDCEDAPAEYFGLDADAMRQVRRAHPSEGVSGAEVARDGTSTGRGVRVRDAPSTAHTRRKRPKGDGIQPAPRSAREGRGRHGGDGNSPATEPLDGVQRRRGQRNTARPRRGKPMLLHLFAGRARASGTIGEAARARGAEVEEVDILKGEAHDLLRPEVYARLLRRAKRGKYAALVAGVLCESFSVLQLRVRRKKRTGAALGGARTRERPEGSDGATTAQHRYLKKHNTLVRRTATLAAAVAGAAGEYILENPADRGDARTKLFRWRWRRHVPLWLMPAVAHLREHTGGTEVTFPQCRLGGSFQKWTTLLASPGAAVHLVALGELECTHAEHARVAEGSAAKEAAEYPALMADIVAAAALRQRPPQLTEDLGNARAADLLRASFEINEELSDDDVLSESGDESEKPTAWRAAVDALPSYWPEREDMLSEATREKLEQELAYTSRRRAEAASRVELMQRPLPTPCPPVEVPAEPIVAYEWPDGAPERPIAIAQLYAPGAYDRVQAWLNSAKTALTAWQTGEATAPLEPLVIREEEQPEWARGTVWDATNPSDCKPVASTTRSDPPRTSMNVKFFDEWAATLEWGDADMVEQVATGVVGRATCERDTVLMLHHTGVRKHFQAFATSVEADTADDRQWISKAYSDLPYVPCRLVAKNVAEQRKWKFDGETGELQEAIKLRVTTDDSAEAGEPGVAPASHNNSLPREEWPETTLPGPRTLAEAVAIVKAAARRLGLDRRELEAEKIALWALDLSDAFRSLPGQRAEYWQHCFVWTDGVRVDVRCIFGSAHMVGLFQRVTTFVLEAVARRIASYDAARPYSTERQAWVAWREQRLGGTQRCDYQQIYLDDGMGLTVLGRGEEAESAEGAPESRAEAHLRIASETFIEAGVEDDDFAALRGSV